MKRIFDLFFSLLILVVLLIPITTIFFLVKITSKGPGIYWSTRIGKNSKEFKMPKFRTMSLQTPEIATHLLSHPEKYYTPIGRFLRSTSLDELPQLFSIIVGDMSFVGPRPALFNQHDLIALREKNGVIELIPGITGWAQINGRDELSVEEKVKLDLYYSNNKSFFLDTKILVLTIFNVIKRNGIAH